MTIGWKVLFAFEGLVIGAAIGFGITIFAFQYLRELSAPEAYTLWGGTGLCVLLMWFFSRLNGTVKFGLNFLLKPELHNLVIRIATVVTKFELNNLVIRIATVVTAAWALLYYNYERSMDNDDWIIALTPLFLVLSYWFIAKAKETPKSEES